VPLLALLKHPLCGIGATDGGRAVSALEQAVLRGPRPRAGSGGLAHALASFRVQQPELHRRDPRRRLEALALDDAAELVGQLAEALAPLETAARAPRSFAELAARHRDAVAALSRDPEGGAGGWSGRDGALLQEVFDEIAASPAAGGLIVTPGDYPELVGTAIADRALRRPDRAGVRVRILGPLEARLQTVERVVLGGLAEGTWPPQARSDPWLSRPMRHELGLDLPERRIGLSAHDFAQALGAPDVILTRAAKVAGAPTVASRFVQRLAAVAGKERWGDAVARGAKYLALARMLDAPARVQRIAQPAPTPPRAARPTALAVTDIESWLRDPYTIYAKHVLRLAPLAAVDTPPGAADRGTVIHKAIGDFTEQFADRLPADSLAELLRLGRDAFATLDDYPEARAFWWPRFQRIARWFADWEQERRARVGALHAEVRGEIRIPLGERVFRLSARADRIERLADGRYAILDYKTGAARTEKQVRLGLAPQLTLEAAILQGGGFKEVGAGASIAEIVYVTLRGGEPAGIPCLIEFKEGTPDSQAAGALARLTELAARFEDETTPYRSLVHPMWKTHYGDYDHLARVKEWSATGGAVDENGGPA
jgi:ATP-dependent helicase/nuclease subunit B